MDVGVWSSSGQQREEDLLDLLDCPICSEAMYPPIFQCPNGHAICASCKPLLRNCPFCNVNMARKDIRCRHLEKVIACLEIPCRYKPHGCREMACYETRLAHEAGCRFKPYDCPCSSSYQTPHPCGFSGDAPAIAAHLQDVHYCSAFVTPFICTRYIRLEPWLAADTAATEVYRCYEQHFCLCIDALPSPTDLVFLVYVALVGEPVDAAKFRYRVEVRKGTGDYKLSWEGVPRSIREGRDRLTRSMDGLVIHQAVARRLSDFDVLLELGDVRAGVELAVEGLIWKEDNGQASLSARGAYRVLAKVAGFLVSALSAIKATSLSTVHLLGWRR